MRSIHLSIQPLDAAIFRDARPFSDGISARSLPFPFPTVTVGTFRTMLGRPSGFADLGSLLEICQTGPFLAVQRNAQPVTLMAPAPADALAYEIDTLADRQADSPLELIPLVSKTLPQGHGCNLPKPLSELLQGGKDQKLSSRIPHFWNWDFFEKWLLQPNRETLVPSAIGPPRLPESRRTHVAIQRSTRTAADQMLFSTTGLEFSAQDASGHWEYSLLSEFRIPEHAPTLPAFPQVHPFGGERRASVWKTSALHLPGCPTSLADPAAARRYRLVLLTPAAFEHGWLPGWLVSGSGCPPGLADIQLKLISAAVPRPVPISGWDLNLRAEKATRLLAPAGSVYVVESSQDLSPLWLQSISDRQQDRNDGFGIVAIGAAYDEES